MNEKIKLLAEQAGITNNNLSDGNMSHNDLEKFARLIIRECARLCDNHGDKVEDDRPNKDLSSAAFDCSDIIREHFGVE